MTKIGLIEIPDQVVVFPGEVEAVKAAIEIGERYGFGNIIAHLMTAWAVSLRDKWGITEEAALKSVHVTPYPLPEKTKALNEKEKL